MKKGLATIFFVISVLSFAQDKKEPKLLGVNLEMKLSPMEEVKYYKSSKKRRLKCLMTDILLLFLLDITIM
jgi:hypothetical protein